MEADYTRKTQETAQSRKLGEQFTEVLSPYRQQFALQGMDEVAAVRQLVSIYDNLQQNPAETIQWLAENYGVDFAQDQEQVDPATQRILQEVNTLKSQLNQNQQAQQAQVQQQIFNEITAFENAKDETGNPKYPHFPQVREAMGKLVASGMANDLDSAYLMAINVNPELSQQVQKTSQEQARKEAEAKKKAAAAKAKKAASGVRSGSNGKKQSEEMTLEEEIRAQIG
jgi:cell division protein ZapA (FtsZ GTPase activity inhibitor)